MNPDPKAAKISADLNMAMARIRERLLKGKAKLGIDAKKYYWFLKQRLGDVNVKQQELMFSEILQKPPFKDNQPEEAKLAASMEVIRTEEEWLHGFKNRVNKQWRQAIQRAALSDKDAIELRRKTNFAETIGLQPLEFAWIDLKALLERVFRVRGKPYVMIISKGKKRPSFIRLVKLTGSIIIAIMAGKYFYNKGAGAYQRRTGQQIAQQLKLTRRRGL